MDQISKKGHFSAVDKWIAIIKKAKAGEKIDEDPTNAARFEDGFMIWSSCSYCDHYGPQDVPGTCIGCPLYRDSDEEFGMRICWSNMNDISNAGNFIRLMLKGRNKEALPHGQKVLNRLNELTKEFGY